MSAVDPTPGRRRDDPDHRPDAVESRLRAALDDGTLALAYQPIVGLPGCRVVGVEALLRWAPGADGGDPGVDEPTPEELVQAAERGPLIRELGAFVLERAFADVVAAFPDPASRIQLSLNVSAAQLADDEVVAHVRTLLETTGWPPDLLCLEITETVALADTAQAARRLASLRELGCRVALDDFGTGWSSLGLLRDLPVDVVKIDRSFVEDVHRSVTDAVLVRSVLEAAHALGQRVCAEGVSVPEQARQLAAMGCDRAQGWWFGRAVPASALPEVARTTHPGLATDQPPPIELGERDQLVVVTDAAHLVRYASAGSIPLLGTSPAGMVGRRFESFLVDDVADEGEHTVRVHHADGHPHWLRVTTQRLEGGEVLWVAVDVTAGVRLDEALAASEARFRTAFDLAPIAMAVNDLDGRFLRVNTAFAELVGRTPAELVRLRYQDITPDEDAGADRRNTEELLAGEAVSHTSSKRYLHADGHAVPVRVRSSLVHDGDGEPGHVVVHVLPDPAG